VSTFVFKYSLPYAKNVSAVCIDARMAQCRVAVQVIIVIIIMLAFYFVLFK
jgi:hypothetical protein